MDNQLYKPMQKSITVATKSSSYQELGGAVRLGIQGPEGLQFALNVTTFPTSEEGVINPQIITLGKYGIYYLDLTGGLGLIQGVVFNNPSADEEVNVLIDYLAIATNTKGVQHEL